jgi:hypothetical protein
MFDKIYLEIEDLYRLLHAYVKKKLVNMYPDKLKLDTGPLPAHVFGDLWAQQWHNIFEEIKPFKNKPILDITPNMKAKVYSILLFIQISTVFIIEYLINNKRI